MTDEELRAALARRKINHAEGVYRPVFVRRRTDPRKANAVELDFAAARVDRKAEPIRFELHLSQERANDRDEVLGLIDDTVTAILDGRLPPGTRELL